MAGNISISAGVSPAQSRTSVSGGFSLPARPAPAPAPAGYQLMYQMGGPRYMYGETPFYGARYADGGIVPGQIYGNMRGSREGADMFGFFPTMFQSQPYATASQMYTPSLGVMPLIGYPSKYPHVIMGGYSDYGAPIANQAMNMMLPLLMMGLYRQMFPMPGAAPAAGAGGGGGKKGGGGGSSESGGGGSKLTDIINNLPPDDPNSYKYKYYIPDPEAYSSGAYKNYQSTDGMPYTLVGPPVPYDSKIGRQYYNKSNEGLDYNVGPRPADIPSKPARLRQALSLVPDALGGLFSGDTAAALQHAKENPVEIPDSVKRTFGAR